MSTFLDKDPDKVEENFFDKEESFTPAPVPSDKALKRVAPLAFEFPDDQVADSMLTMAEANAQNAQSTLEIEALIKDEEDRLENLAQAAAQAITEDPSPETIDAYNEILIEQKAIVNYDLKEYAAKKQMMGNTTANKPIDERSTDLETWFDQSKHIAKIQTNFDESLKEEGFAKAASLASILMDTFLPTSRTGRFQEIAKKFNPEDYERIYGWTIGGLLRNTQVGTAKEIIAKRFLDAPLKDRVKLMQELADIVATSGKGLYFDATTQYITKDGVNKKIAFEEIVERINKGNIDGINWGMTVDNVLGFLEIAPLFLRRADKVYKEITGKGPEPKPAIELPPPPRGPKGEPTSPEHMVVPTKENYINPIQDNFKGASYNSLFDYYNVSNPYILNKILGTQNEQVLAAAGLSLDDVINRTIPKPAMFNSTGISSSAIEALDGNFNKINKILNTVNPEYALTTLEVETAIATQTAASLRNITSAVPVGDGTKLTFYPNGFDVDNMFGKNTGQGYASLGEAKAMVKTYGGNLENIDIVHWNPRTTQYDIVKKEFIKTNEHDIVKGDFFVVTKEKYFYTDETVLDLTNPNFGGKTVLRTSEIVAPVVGLFGGKQFTLPSKVTLPASRSEDVKSALTKQIAITTKPFLKAPMATKKRVEQALSDGNRDKTTYTLEEFMVKYDASQKDYDVYGQMRLFYDALWQARGTAISEALQGKGYRYIALTPEARGTAISTEIGSNSGPSILEHYIGKPTDVKNLPSTIKRVYDPIKNKSVSVKNAGAIYQLDTPQSFQGSEYNYITVGNSAKVTKLPSNVLKYEEGYIEIFYTDPYNVYLIKDKFIDGVRQKNYQQLVGTFPGREAADLALKAHRNTALNEGEVRPEFTVSRKEPEDYSSVSDIGPYTKWYQKREGDLQRGLFGEEGPTPQASAITSIERTIASFSRITSTGSWIDFNKQRYMKSFDKDKGLLVPGEFSPPSKKLLASENGALAQQMYDYLELMAGMNIDQDNFITNLYKYSTLTLGRFLERGPTTFSKKAGQAIQNEKIAGFKPTDFLRGAAFYMLVGLHPLRQLLQNPLTHLYLSSLDPKMGSLAARDAIGLIGAISTKNLNPKIYEKALWSYAKSLGTDLKTANQSVEAFINSGLISELDARQIYSSGITNSSNEVQGIARRIAGVPVRGVKGLAEGIKAVGFKAGEVAFMAQIAPFTLRNQMRVTGKSLKEILNSRNDMDEVFATARQLSGNQNKAGISNVQRKLPLLTNLTSFVMSMSLNMAFDNAASSTFRTLGKGSKKKMDFIRSKNNQTKFILGSLILYGTSSFEPIVDTFEEYVGPINPVVKKLLFFNLVNTAFNGFLETVTGEESTGDWSNSVNPASIIPLMAQVWRTAVERAAIDFHFGAAGSSVRKVDSMWAMLKMMMIDDTVSPSEAVVKGADIIAKGISKGWLDASKGYDAYVRQQAYFTDLYGNKVGNVTLPNTIAKLFGVKLYEERARQRIRQTEKQNNDDYRETATYFFQYMLYMSKGEGISQEDVDRFDSMVNSMTHWDQVARDKFNESISNKFADYYSKDSALRESIARWMGQNTAPARATLKKLVDDPITPDYEKEIINNYLKLTSGND